MRARSRLGVSRASRLDWDEGGEYDVTCDGDGSQLGDLSEIKWEGHVRSQRVVSRGDRLGDGDWESHVRQREFSCGWLGITILRLDWGRGWARLGVQGWEQSGQPPRSAPIPLLYGAPQYFAASFPLRRTQNTKILAGLSLGWNIVWNIQRIFGKRLYAAKLDWVKVHVLYCTSLFTLHSSLHAKWSQVPEI